MARKICVLGVPMDLGGSHRGVDMGPSALRIAGLGERLARLGLDYEDLGNLAVREVETLEASSPRARFLADIASCCGELRRRVLEILEAGSFPLVLGGDHSIACGTVAGISDHLAAEGGGGGQALGLIWFDAHGDMNTPETSHSGNVHGMPLAAILGQGPEELLELGLRRPLVNPEQVALVGIRDLDREEARAVRASGVRHFTMRDIDARGIHAVMEEALAVVTSGTAGFHLSFDVDGVDPAVTPGVGTPVPGGTDWRESHLVMELAAESGSLLGLEVVEVNPILDTRNTTAEVAVDLILSALGKTII
ncbi:MAG: arginase [Planctomycetota bacterium]|nr:arginase [Planctomycetota bacterium]MDP6370448.1 arginase [Planctomycetota bacterium]MDP6519204.1 arginase [Planctomycetota bacterium]MDP6839103.1 arginase [Planctomycetota bacterium]MDP6956104.1 arginase [Planctomycetota bacterium]